MRWRAPACLCALVFGVMVSKLPLPWALALICSLTTLAFILRAPHERHIRLLLVALALAGLAAGKASVPQPFPHDLAERWADREIEGWGLVRDIPVERAWGTEVLIDLSALRGADAWVPVRGGVALRFDGVYPQLGETVHFKSKLRAFRNLGIPGEYDQVAREHGRGVFLRGVVSTEQWQTVAPAGEFARVMAEARKQILTAAKARLTSESYSVFGGLALGERGMSKSLGAAWRDAGVTHLVSISGLHLAIVYLVLRWLARMLLSVWPPFLLFLNAGWWSGLIAIPGVAIYTLMSGSQAPTLRSLAMLVVVFLAQGLGRRVSGLAPLCWGAAGLVAVSPGLVFSPGFQLSFAAVAGAIAWNRVTKVEFGGADAHRAKQAVIWVAGAVLSSIVATVWTMPFTTYHFGQVSIIGILANLPLIPYVSLLLTPLCFFFACAAGLWPEAPLPWFLVEYGCRLANITTRFFAEIPGAVVNVRIDMMEIGILLLIIGFASVAMTTPTRRWRMRAGLITVVCVALFVGHEWRRSRNWSGPLRVDVLSIGQGDAILLSSAGKHILLDTGGGHGSELFERTLYPYFISQRIQRLDKLLLSHPHEDHVGAAEEILLQMEVGELVVPSKRHFAQIRPEILEAASMRGVPISEWSAGEHYEWGEVRFRVLHPSPAYREAFTVRHNINDISLVVQAESSTGACVLLTGDAEEEAEHAMADRLAPCSLLKVGHHGSRTSSSDTLLDRVHPRFALISAGYRNQFRHPHAVTTRRLAHAKVGIYATLELGTITARASGNDWEIESHARQHAAWPGSEESMPTWLYSTHLLGIDLW